MWGRGAIPMGVPMGTFMKFPWHFPCESPLGNRRGNPIWKSLGNFHGLSQLNSNVKCTPWKLSWQLPWGINFLRCCCVSRAGFRTKFGYMASSNWLLGCTCAGMAWRESGFQSSSGARLLCLELELFVIQIWKINYPCRRCHICFAA